MTPQDKLEKIRKRQTARLLFHLETTDQLTAALRQDLMRSLSWMFGDVAELLAGVCGDAIPARETGAEWRPGE
jgi:hypothetical protein